jgi:hypothetical protein
VLCRFRRPFRKAGAAGPPEREYHLNRRVIVSLAVAAAALLAGVRGSGTGSSVSATMSDRDSLEAMVRFLSTDPSTSESRTRYAFREAEIGLVADSLAARLERYTGVTPVRQTWTHDGHHDSTFTLENIVCRVEAAGQSSGVLLVTAHFDAISHRSYYGTWDEEWKTAVTPGADDNATGVAALMEAARLLPAIDLPFDIEFVLFTGEELGRLGSIYYVDLCDAGCAEDHLGVINADMIGYPAGGTGATVMSDFRSGWLADMIIDYAASVEPGFDISLIKPGPSNWDHASFWEREDGRLPAITMAEPLASTGSILYPEYHTVDDTIGNVDFDQVQTISSIINGFISSFSGAPAENSMLESDLLILVNGAIRFENVFEAGEMISVRPRVRNTGGSFPPEGAYLHLDVWLENSGGKKKIWSGELAPADPLKYSSVDIALGTGEGLGGQNIVTAEITVSGMDDDPSDNTASAAFVMEGTGSTVENHHISPNPIKTSFSSAQFCINTTEEVNLNLDIFNIEGQRLGSASLGSGYGSPIPTGLSCHPCGELFPGIGELASGIYLYRLVVFTADGQSTEYHERFAVEN